MTTREIAYLQPMKSPGNNSNISNPSDWENYITFMQVILTIRGYHVQE